MTRTTKVAVFAVTLPSLFLFSPAATHGQTPGERLPAWTQAASSCIIDEASASQSRYAFNNADLTFRTGTISAWSNGYQPIVARCNVLNPLDTGNPAWNRLIVGYLDPWGAGSVTVRLKAMVRSSGAVTTVATWNNGPSSGIFTRLEGYVNFVHTFDFLANLYYVEIQILRHDTDGNPGVYMVRLAPAGRIILVS